MRLLTIGLNVLIAIAATIAWSQELAPHSPPPEPSGATNSFTIHLQEGFYQNRETVIKVDGREVYRGTPKTMPTLGLATVIPVRMVAQHPVIAFTMPDTQIRWSKQIDLSAGTALGISVQTNGVVKVLQAKGFAYD